jgi:CDGSH-type Zn-finger protein/uncharacterized Fe-S cluster protein YjdI
MKKSEHAYRGEDVSIHYDAARCIHAAECVRGLPRVFDPERKPWIDAEKAPADQIARTVEKCPTGALTYELRDGAEEAPPSKNLVTIAADGPLFFKARLEIEDGPAVYRAALCRCGDSGNKPFCDNAHVECQFTDSGALGDGGVRGDREQADHEVLRIKPVPDGPLLLEGPVELVSADGGERRHGTRAALCRCGASKNKPFCDGSHAKSGFRSG